MRRYRNPKPPRTTLTPREREVLTVALKVDDTRDKFIADKMHLAKRTVETHFTNIRHKLGVHTKWAAMRRFLESIMAGTTLLVTLTVSGAEAVLHVERRTNEVVLYISGGMTNTQYEIWTEANNQVNGTNWYYWGRLYPTNFQADANKRIQGPNVTYRAQRYFRIGGVLPN